MKEYIWFYRGWHKKTIAKGMAHRSGFLERSLIDVCFNSKRFIPKEEGFLILSLMKRKYNRTHKIRHQHEYDF
jgi:hypothetical protein